MSTLAPRTIHPRGLAVSRISIYLVPIKRHGGRPRMSVPLQMSAKYHRHLIPQSLRLVRWIWRPNKCSFGFMLPLDSAGDGQTQGWWKRPVGSMAHPTAVTQRNQRRHVINIRRLIAISLRSTRWPGPQGQVIPWLWGQEEMPPGQSQQIVFCWKVQYLGNSEYFNSDILRWVDAWLNKCR